jgi:hypothetical protein
MKIFYRLSDGSYPKVRFDNATKKNCLRNFLNHFVFYYGATKDQDQLIVFADNVKDKTYDWIAALTETNDFDVRRTNAGSSAGSFRLVLEEALKLDDDEIVYFVEDDYAHLPNSREVLLEGLERAHYVTLYNHPDKYIPASKGGNPLIGDDGAERTKIFVTDSSYWMMTNSTTMTFATTVSVLREDASIWRKFTEGSYPQDMNIFLTLKELGRSLVQPIPTKATHCEPTWAAHLHGTGIYDWNIYLKPTVPLQIHRQASF